ncbi:MAG: hypothetical protein RR404_03000 [Bacilli bacterium]
MNFVKKNKWALIYSVIFIVVMIFAIVGIVDLIVPNGSKSLYGDRLDGIEKVNINQDTVSLIKQTLMDTKKIDKIDYDLQGKLINFIITVKDTTDKVTAKSLADKILANFTEEQQKYYDFQVFIKMETESEIFPIIGYKHFSSLNFVWTNN